MADPGWTAIVLAGQRPEGDALAQACGQRFKALIPVAGRSMLLRVCTSLLNSEQIKRIVILAQEPEHLLVGDTASLMHDPRVTLAVSNFGIASSIAEIVGSDQAPWPVLVTTADNALLTTELVAEFLRGVGDSDIAVGVGERRLVESMYPATRRTWLKFSDGHYSGANLFALRGTCVLPALELWAGIEQDRKRSLSIMSRFGPRLLFRALTRTITFSEAIEQAGLRLGAVAKPVILSSPEAAIDVDKLTDLKLAEEILANIVGTSAVPNQKI